MAKKKSLLEQIEANPSKGWSVDDLAKLCAEHGIEWSAPTRGSHYKATSPHLAGILTVPYNRPIKVIYIKKMCGMIQAHIRAKAKTEEDKK